MTNLLPTAKPDAILTADPLAGKRDSVCLKSALGQFMGATLQNMRRAEGYSVQELAEKTGISTALVIDIESGKHSPALIDFYDMAVVLNFNPVELLIFAESAAIALQEADAE